MGNKNVVECPKVSIIVPVYNVEPWLCECMDSLVNQTLKEIEIICINDGSPDNCGMILDKYAKNDGRVKVIHQKNMGVSMARNAGLDIARGEYVAFVDPDDYVELNAYKIAYKYAKKDNIDILNFKARWFDDKNDNHMNNIDLSDAPILPASDFFAKNYNYCMWDNFIKREIIQNTRFIPNMKMEDTFFMLAIIGKAQKAKSIPAKFYNYRQREGSTVHTIRYKNRFIEAIKFIKSVVNSWRNGNYLKNNESTLLALILKKMKSRKRWAKKYAQEILDSFGNDIYNDKIIKKCPQSIQKEIKFLEKAANQNKLKKAA